MRREKGGKEERREESKTRLERKAQHRSKTREEKEGKKRRRGNDKLSAQGRT